MPKYIDVTTPLMIYASVTGLAIFMCLWTILTAVVGDPEFGWRHRILTGCVATLVLCTTAVVVFSADAGRPRLVWLMGLLPVLTLAATWSNVVALRQSGPWVTLIGLPITLFNLIHLGLYAVVFAQTCLGVGLGAWGAALACGDAHLQSLVGSSTAPDDPIWLRLPIVVPLWGRKDLPQRLALLANGVCATGVLTGLIFVMPHAYRHCSSYREALAVQPSSIQKRSDPQKPDRASTEPTATDPSGLGIRVPWGRRSMSAAERQRIRKHLQSLGARHVTYDVTRQAVNDPTRLHQIQEETTWARGVGLRTIAVARPSAHFADIPAGTLSRLRQDLAETHWLTAEHLQPDLLVLFAGPCGRLDRCIVHPPTLAEWLKAIRTSAAEARQARKDIRVAVSIEGRSVDSKELFRVLRGEASAVDVVGLSIYPDRRQLDTVERYLAQLSRWCERTPGERRILILETGCAPQFYGGEIGQWNFLSRVLRFGATTPGIDGVSIDSLYDRESDFGLIRRVGRRSLSYRRLAAHLGTGAQPPK